MSIDHHDIAVIGAGPAGAAAALALAHAGFGVALVGPSPPPADGRTIAVMGPGWQMLDEWGVAETLQPGAAPLAVMRLVDDTGSLFKQPPVEFKAAEMGLDAFGWNVEATALAGALGEAASAHPRITRIIAPASAITGAAGSWLVETPKGVVSAGLLAGADGRNSIVRRHAGIEARDWSYPQSALTTILTHSRDHREVSTEFHTRAGPCTLVPLPGRRSSLVWMTTPSDGERLMALDDAALALAIERQCHSILGAMSVDGPRGLVPMRGMGAARLSMPGLALVGEAAHVFPPIGAQGLNLGLRDIADLARIVSDARDRGEPIHGPQAMSRYEMSRKPDVESRTFAVDALNRSLLSPLLPVDFGRGLGLLALSAIGPLRRLAMRQGLGARG